MNPALGLIGLWLLFGGSHMLLSDLRVRRRVIDAIGERGHQGLYAVAAFGSFALLIWYYSAHHHEGAQLWNLVHVPGITPLAQLLMAVALIAWTASFVNPSPAALRAGQSAFEPRGLTRITRHPQMFSVATFGAAHCLVDGFLHDVIFWGGLTVFAVAAAWHQDQRKIATVPAYAAFAEQTSFWPFGAVAAGRQRLALGEVSWKAGAVGALIFILLQLYHARLFG